MRNRAPNRPNRCQGITHNGQCFQDAQPGSNYCRRHGTHRDLVMEQDKRLYRLQKHQARLAEFTEHEDVKNLREEIAITRILIEERFNLIQNENDLLAACSSLNALLLTVDKLVQSAHKLEANLGSLLAKPTLLGLGNEIIAIIVDELKDILDYEQIVDRISDRLLQAIAKAGT